MVAGHLLIGLVNGVSLHAFLLIFPLGLLLIFLELSVAIIQSYVFTNLRIIFYSPLNSLKIDKLSVVYSKSA